jgi:hypothetical protein
MSNAAQEIKIKERADTNISTFKIFIREVNHKIISERERKYQLSFSDIFEGKDSYFITVLEVSSLENSKMEPNKTLINSRLVNCNIKNSENYFRSKISNKMKSQKKTFLKEINLSN